MGNLKTFSFGYYGWGNSTPQLIQAVDAVERSRGFKPPIFVDVRLQRSVRAPGFNGNAFGNLLGKNRHRWMKSLGNLQIADGSLGGMQIADPKSVNQLLDIAVEATNERRRVIFFCGCQYPCENGKKCHRTKVASLMVSAAKRKGIKIEVVEWPGEKPIHYDFEIDSKSYKSLIAGKWYIPPNGLTLAEAAEIPWGSTAKILSGDQQVMAVIGPAQFRLGKWQLPVFETAEGYSESEIKQDALQMRKSYGFSPLISN